MSKTSIKDTMVYFDIASLEDKLEKDYIATALWSTPTDFLEAKLRPYIPNCDNKELSFYKDKSTETDVKGSTLFKGLFVVASDKKITGLNLALLFSNFIKENPGINREIPAYAYSGIASKKVNTKTDDVSGKLVETSSLDMAKKPAFDEDLNEAAKNIDSQNLIFGVIDDSNHIDIVSKIQGVEIINGVGDFKKTYFSIPSYRQAEVLAHSVSILPYVKCKRALLDFI